MDPLAARALARLRDPGDDALDRLARIVVRHTADTPIRDVAEPRWIASQLAAAIEAVTHGEHARAAIVRRLEDERARWTEEERPACAFVPPEAERGVRALLGREAQLGEDLTFRILDQPAIRALLREVLLTTFRGVRERVRAETAGLGDRLRAEAGRGARRGKGLFGAVGIGAMADNVRGLTEGLVGAVREEFEQTLDARLGDPVRGATTEAVRTMARYLADPAHAAQLAEMRLAVFDVLLDTPVRELVAEAGDTAVADVVDVVLATLRAAVEGEGFVDRAERRIARLLAEAGDGTLGAWLEEVGLAAIWIDSTTELLSARLRAVVGTDDFAAWWAGLFEA